MTELSDMSCSEAADALSVAGLRAELELTLAEMGERIGLSKSQMHEVERSGRASLRVALAIEELSGRRIDAASLNDDVKASRHGLANSGDGAAASTGQVDEESGEFRTQGAESAIDDELVAAGREKAA